MIALRGLLVLLALSFTACSGDDDAGSADAGGPKDAGGDAALVWNPDTGVGVGDGGGQDAAVDPNCGKATRDFFFAIPAPRCEQATQTCVLNCEAADGGDKEACRKACIAADQHTVDPSATWADCDSCIFSQLMECGHTNSCAAPIEEFFCCIESMCPSGSPDTCAEAKCSGKINDAITCIYTANPECLGYDQPFIGGCFETDDGDAGVDDAGK
jgi:hypothetical protein